MAAPPVTAFSKILVANRGEIACRVMVTARRMGVSTVAVFSEPDADARHVQMADEAYAIGPAPARQSYLRGDAIIAAALRSGAQAIHPGYGFLSENADFAEACAAAGLVFIGPPAAAMRAMGSKSAAKSLMEQSGVPLVPGYHGEDQALAVIAAAAAAIGYPVLLKASAGGGGRGMRVVERADALKDAVERAQGEARGAFGDDRLLVEKYLTHPRHIEVQVFGDTHGNIVSLFERDCSVQRRHQKVLEESPAPGITPAQRQALGDAAVAAARAVGYVGAGTVEFITEDDRFYFMEMNTRLQVEHPVTEFVTGLDLVEWQLRVAAGEALPWAGGLRMEGHAIEARICAEDPERDFMPATGMVTFLRQPRDDAHVRVDTGIRQGDSITPHYDSMIAKLIVWDRDRPSALRRLSRALDEYELVGPHTNLDLLRRIAVDPDFMVGGVDTGFIGQHAALLQPKDGASDPELWAAASLALLRILPCQPPGDPWSPWGEADGWRSLAAAATTLDLRAGAGAVVSIEAEKRPDGWQLALPTGRVLACLSTAGADGEPMLTLNGARTRLRTLVQGDTVVVIRQGRNHPFTRIDRFAAPEEEEAADAKLTAPTPGRVVSVFVEPGAVVVRGQKLLILEAMKVETTFAAPRDGVVEAVHVRADELVQEGKLLVSFAASMA